MPNASNGNLPAAVLAVKMDSNIRDILEQYFTFQTVHSWQDAADALVFMTSDLGGRLDEIGNAAVNITVILDKCNEVAPNLETFHRWKNMHIALDHDLRLASASSTPVTWWPVAFAYWLLSGQPAYAHNAMHAVYAFRKCKVKVSDAMDVVIMLQNEPESTNRHNFMELLEGKALMNEDLSSPAAAFATLYDKRIPYLIARWQATGRSKNLRRIAGILANEARRRSKVTVIQERIPEKAIRLAAVNPVQASEPSSLPEILEAHLPGKANIAAEHVARALLVMKAEEKTWSIDAIISRVQQMIGSTRIVARRLIEDALKWLAKNGVLDKSSDGYRIRKESDHPIGDKILQMI